jgi:nucleoid-associated protein YgaU
MDETLNDDIVSEEDTIASTVTDEGLEDTNTAAIELDQTPRVETAFAKTEETSRERKSIEYIVKKNDNLWGIAQRFYKKGHLNKKIIEDNKLGSPHIKPGDVLRIYL